MVKRLLAAGVVAACLLSSVGCGCSRTMTTRSAAPCCPPPPPPCCPPGGGGVVAGYQPGAPTVTAAFPPATGLPAAYANR
jgi:hypothetical protein